MPEMTSDDLASLAGRRIRVAGTSSGSSIGREAAASTGRLGARVVLVGRDRGWLESDAALIPGDGHRVGAFKVGSAGEQAEMAERIRGNATPARAAFPPADAGWWITGTPPVMDGGYTPCDAEMKSPASAGSGGHDDEG